MERTEPDMSPCIFTEHENETPRTIAQRLSEQHPHSKTAAYAPSAEQIVNLNIHNFPDLKLGSKLLANTLIFIGDVGEASKAFRNEERGNAVISSEKKNATARLDGAQDAASAAKRGVAASHDSGARVQSGGARGNGAKAGKASAAEPGASSAVGADEPVGSGSAHKHERKQQNERKEDKKQGRGDSSRQRYIIINILYSCFSTCNSTRMPNTTKLF